MSPIPNGLNSYGDSTMNLHGSNPIQMSSSFPDHDTRMVRSVFITSGHTNHHGLFSSSRHAINCYQDLQHISSSSSSGFNNSHVAYQMRENMVSNVVDYFPLNNNPHLSQVTITETITNGYSAIVPTSNLVTIQNEYERAMNPNILSPSFYPPTFVDKQCEILNPTPLNTIPPHENSVFPRHLDLFSFSPRHQHDQHVPHRRPVKKRCKPTKYFEESFDGSDSEKDGEYDGKTHSLPYEKYGPYTCPKCNNVFDTSQKFAAHISSIHYKNETVEERAKRYNARNKKRFRKTNQMIHGESQMIQTEDRVVEESRGYNNIVSDIEAFQHHPIVKEEPVHDFV
ncbi:hypothetical protein EUTSA_v10015522mg [Eutrema salsugineum]|uniref:C2H2-type domain-containing protein n=1 Tax=Eutrema salsugineum TaxID=72664 RepID=V4LIK2_EUTSA|nr:uncharacterized protein LOC18016575 [Eutrema salsugineum]ESQ42262.1 hypothetical protein EUTSA_v10015522mg [Eutrema salsugineum]